MNAVICCRPWRAVAATLRRQIWTQSWSGAAAAACDWRAATVWLGLGSALVVASSLTRPSSCHRHAAPAPPRAALETLAPRFDELLEESSAWKRERYSNGPGYEISVWASPSRSPLTSGLRYRKDVVIDVSRLEVDDVLHHLLNFKEREKWDKNILAFEILSEHSGSADAQPRDEPFLARYRTAPAAGGIVTSREFVAARMLLPHSGGWLLIDCRWDQESGLMPSKGTTRAFNVPGCNFVFTCKDDKGCLRIITFSQSEIGGWLPVHIVSRASMDVHIKLGQNLLRALGVIES